LWRGSGNSGSDIRAGGGISWLCCSRGNPHLHFLVTEGGVDRIIGHLKLSFVAERPPPPHIAYKELLMAPEAPAEYLS